MTVNNLDLPDRISEERSVRPGESKDRPADGINQRIFETSLDLILVVSRQGELIRVSPSSRTILGYSPEEMVGRSAANFVHADDIESARNEMRMARRGRLTRNFECRYVHKDGRIVALAWAGVWSEPEEQHFFIGRDMTQRIAAEESLRHSQRLAALGQLTGGLAHDFNNLLSVIIGNLDLLDEEFAANPKARDLAQRALDASLRGAELIRQLLAFARNQPLDAKAFDLNELVLKTTDLLQRTLGEQITIDLNLAKDLWPTLADPSQVESALTNLAINARDAMPGGGRLSIETANTHLDEAYAAENIEVAPGGYVMLAVSDSGTGMAPDILAHAFEPFFTTKAAGKGTGLGLSMVYGFAKQSHGHVKIYSELGHGTTVRLYLPRTRGGVALPTDEPDDDSIGAASGATVLVVEDKPEVRRVAVKQLAEFGYKVTEADLPPFGAAAQRPQTALIATCP